MVTRTRSSRYLLGTSTLTRLKCSRIPINKESQSQQAAGHSLSFQLGRRINRSKLRGIKPNWNNKMKTRGIVRIIEAVIAIMIIFGVLLTIYGTRQAIISQRDLSEIIPSLLEEISKNVTLREKIVSNSNAIPDINSFLANRIKEPYINYSVQICNPNDLCSLSSYPKNTQGDIFTSERIISATLTQYNPKKVKIYLWRTR